MAKIAILGGILRNDSFFFKKGRTGREFVSCKNWYKSDLKHENIPVPWGTRS